MSCVIVGSLEDAEKIKLPKDAVIVPPQDFQGAIGYMTRLVMIGPRLLNDRDIKLADQVPVAIVLTNPTDVLHTEMHIRAGRLCLTPSDAIVVDERLSQRRFAPWIDLLALKADDLAAFMAQEAATPLHPVPSGLETLTKPMLNELAAQMRKLQLTQYDCVMGSSAACRSLIGTMCNLANSMLAEIETLPPDVICAEPGAVADQLAAHPCCRLLICPAIIDGDNPVELVNLTVTTATRAPVNLVQVISGSRLPQSRILTYLIYAIG